MATGTLESRVADRLSEFKARWATARDPEERRALDEEETRFLLDAVPFIREYTDGTVPVAAGDPSALAGQLANFVEVTHTSKRNNVLQRYLMHVEKQVDSSTVAAIATHGHEGAANPTAAEYVCPECDAGMVFNARESNMVCTACGFCRPYSEMNTTNLTYDQEINQYYEHTYYSYKRLNHFCEWLNSLQAKVSGQFRTPNTPNTPKTTPKKFLATHQHTTTVHVRKCGGARSLPRQHWLWPSSPWLA